MKLLVIFLFLYTTFAFSKSRVGEWAAYDYQEITPTSVTKGTLLKEIVEEKQLVSSAGKKEKFLRISEKMLTGETISFQSEKWERASQYSNQFGSHVQMLKCKYSSSFGTVEKIQVKAGRFSACKSNDKEIWLGAVPFNQILSIQYEDQLFRRLELVKFSWKKK